MPRSELSDPLKDRRRLRHVGKTQKSGDGLLVDPIVETRICLQRSEFGAEEQRAVRPSVVQRLFAESVTGQGQRARGPVPQRERKHATNLLESTLHTPASDGGEQCLGVRVTTPCTQAALVFKSTSQVKVVVNLAVKNDDESSRDIPHRLRAGRRQVED